jgi:beta-galactosidase/beta-glucuronidase
MKKAFFILSALLTALSVSAQQSTDLTEWQFSKDGQHWTDVTVPHSYNAEDGHSPKYYRGKAYYKRPLKLSKEDLRHPVYLLFEGAAQQATVFVNGKEARQHQGGHNAFYVLINPLLQKDDNWVSVTCDNHEDVNVIPVSSDFNKNGGLHYPVHMLRLNDVYFSPESKGLHRLHVTTPTVSRDKAVARVEVGLANATTRKKEVAVRYRITDNQGRIVQEQTEVYTIPALANDMAVSHAFEISKPHLWDGVHDPYRYRVEATLLEGGKRVTDRVESRVGFRFYSVDKDAGFSLNGKPYPLRGVAEHQDMEGKTTAMSRSDFDRDYQIIKELGCNFLRLAHYPHNDYEYDLCDSLGIIVQTEIPWVNVCGLNAQPVYFQNIETQLREMVSNLYNHPSIIFWGLWNELDSWGNNDRLQGKIDWDRIVSETARLYAIAKQLDPQRLVGMSDCSVYRGKGYEQLRGDFYSENRYNGWYYNVGNMENFSKEYNDIHQRMGVTNVSEYGAGADPYCHTTDTVQKTLRADDKRHFEEYANLFHESHVRQIKQMPFLNFTAVWVLFDFPVADRKEGFMDSDDGYTFKRNESRLYTNDKGLVTRDRKVKKDAFYLYKSLWNHHDKTVYITSRRLRKADSELPYSIKVYSNAMSLSLYLNGKFVQTLSKSSDETGVIWRFNPVMIQEGVNTIKVVGDDTFDEVTIEGVKGLRKTAETNTNK